MGKSSVKVKDLGWKALMKLAKERGKEGNKYVKVGLLGAGDKHRESGDTISSVELGTIHEYGAPRAGIPERSFLRRTANEKEAEWLELSKKLLVRVLSEKIDWAQALGLLGARAANDVKKTITNETEIPPPLMPEYFMRKLLKNKGAEKRFNATGIPPRTLVDTGQMVQSITWGVVIDGAEQPKGGGGENG